MEYCSFKNLVITKIVKKIVSLCGTGSFIPVLAKDRLQSLTSILSFYKMSFSIIPSLVQICHMIHPSRFPSEHLYAILIPSLSTTWPTYLILRDLNTLPALFGKRQNFTHFLKQSSPTFSHFLSFRPKHSRHRCAV